MKTKIIYISGNEVFEMSEIRAAFDEVRSTLGLDNDTILFGVPVDSDNALESSKTIKSQHTETVCSVIDEEKEAEQIVATPQEIVNTPVYEENIEETPEIIANEKSEVFVNLTEDIAQPTEHVKEEKIIPILSVLAVNQNTEPECDTVEEPEVADTYKENVVPEQMTTNEEMVTTLPEQEDTLEASSASTTEEIQNIEKITIGDMIDEAPVMPEKKTLEQLLESMTPLREDVEHDIQDITDNDTIDTFDMDTNDTDATLAQLASEFAENEDKIVTTSVKAEPQGKIGKLKNILPFKKAKRDDGGLMGDLFGWAGIAANDDDFTMPGFFTGAKKQGA